MVGVTMLGLFVLGVLIAALGHPGIFRVVFGGNSRSNDHSIWYE